MCAALLVAFTGGCAKPQQPQANIRYAGDKAVPDAGWQPGPDKPPTPKTLFAMSRVLAAQGRDAEASVLLQGVIRDAPAFLPAYTDLAGIRMRQHDAAAAVNVLTAGLKVAPKDAVLLNDLGVAYLSMHSADKALAAFDQAVAAAPRQVRYQSNRALALAMLGRYDEALTAYEQVLPPAQAHHNVAIVCDWRNDKERATVEHARALMFAHAQGRIRPCASHGATAARPAESAVTTSFPQANDSQSIAKAPSPAKVRTVDRQMVPAQESPAVAMMPIAIASASAEVQAPAAPPAPPAGEVRLASEAQPVAAAQAQPAALWELCWWPDVNQPLQGNQSLASSQVEQKPVLSNQ